MTATKGENMPATGMDNMDGDDEEDAARRRQL
jgi:hypothetical protein